MGVLGPKPPKTYLCQFIFRFLGVGWWREKFPHPKWLATACSLYCQWISLNMPSKWTNRRQWQILNSGNVQMVNSCKRNIIQQRKIVLSRNQVQIKYKDLHAKYLFEFVGQLEKRIVDCHIGFVYAQSTQQRHYSWPSQQVLLSYTWLDCFQFIQ